MGINMGITTSAMTGHDWQPCFSTSRMVQTPVHSEWFTAINTQTCVAAVPSLTVQESIIQYDTMDLTGPDKRS
jgi:hypothetical protein